MFFVLYLKKYIIIQPSLALLMGRIMINFMFCRIELTAQPIPLLELHQVFLEYTQLLFEHKRE